MILDFVPNHTSDRHPWFSDSRSSRESARRDWYIWRDPAPGGGPPNNWLSNFGGSAWEFDEKTGQYYLHGFLKEQPDLNWRNAAVRQAMHDVLRFWLDRGVDGFRVDVIAHLIKDEQFRDDPPNPAYRQGQPEMERHHQLYSINQPEVHDAVAGLRSVLDEYDDRVMIGEVYLPLPQLVAYYGKDLRGAHMPFNFQLIQAKWDARHISAIIAEYEALLPPGGWPNWVLGNHDRARIAGRVGPAQARVAAMMLLTLRGTPTLYYGDELGMEQVPIPPELVQDPWERREPDLGFGRDPVRTPMQWDRSPSAGFSTGTPWLPLEKSWATRNVETERDDPTSMLSLYRRLIALRRKHPALSIGTYREVQAGDGALVYERAHEGEVLLVALNLGGQPVRVELPGELMGRIVLSCLGGKEDDELSGSLQLAGNDGIILRRSA